MDWTKVLIGVGLSAAAGAVSYLGSPDFLTALVATYPSLAVAAPLVTFVVGWLLPQLKVWGAKVEEKKPEPSA